MKNLEGKIKKLDKIEKKLKRFSDLLNEIGESDSKLGSMWLEVYENAHHDRAHANQLFDSVFEEIKLNPANHAVYGAQASKYLERLCKSNEQILKLAELVQKSYDNETQINPDEIFSRIEQAK
jgi:hypothetical protein